MSKKTVFIFLLVTSLLGVFVFADSSDQKPKKTNPKVVSIQNGTQTIELKAKAGYSPSSIKASANLPSILRVITDKTFDCSSDLTIPSLKITQKLPITGSTNITIPPQKPGTKILVTCSMGMYSSTIEFFK
jgi:plastocyanin domain-containing protein